MLGAVSLPNIPSGNSLVVKDAEMLPAKTTGSLGSSGAVSAMSPMDSAFAIFSEMRDSLQQVVENTGKTVELLTSLTSLETNEAIQDQREDRAGSIERGETDEPKEKGPGVLSKVGGALQSVNPFSENFGFGTFGKLILAGAGLLALNLFGDKLIDPIANLLEVIKAGTTGTLISDTIEKIKTELTPYWEDIKVQVGLFIDNVKMVYESIVGVVRLMRDYVMQFDTQGKVIEGGPLKGLVMGDGKLDDQELSAMFGDLKEKIVTPIVEEVYAIASRAAMALILGLGFIQVANILSKLSPFAVASGTGGDGKNKGNTKKGKPSKLSKFFKIAKLSKFGIAALGSVVLAGLFAFAADAAFAINSALDDQVPNKDDIDKELDQQRKDKAPGIVNKLLSAFMVGPETGMGKFVDVLSNGFNKGLMGAALGATTFTPFGMLAGFIGGSIFGAMSAYFGEEKVSRAIDSMFGDQTPFGMTIDYLFDVYETLILKPFEFIFGKLGVKNDSFFSRAGARYDKMDGKPLTKGDIFGTLAVDQSVADSMSKDLKVAKIAANQRKLDEIEEVYKGDLTHDQKRGVKKLELENARMKESLEREFGVDYETLKRFNFNLDPHAGTINNFKSSGVHIHFDEYVAKKLSDMGVNLKPADIKLGGENPTPGFVLSDKSVKDSYNNQNVNVLDGLSLKQQHTAELLAEELRKGRL